MSDTTTLVAEVREYVVSLLSTELPDNITYHSIGHTIDVVTSCLEIAKEQDLSDQETEIVEIAAWFHDVGYADTCKGHEESGVIRA